MIVIPCEYEESPDAIRWRFFTSLRSVQNDKLVQTERGLTYALRDKIPMREKSRKEKSVSIFSLYEKRSYRPK